MSLLTPCGTMHTDSLLDRKRQPVNNTSCAADEAHHCDTVHTIRLSAGILLAKYNCAVSHQNPMPLVTSQRSSIPMTHSPELWQSPSLASSTLYKTPGCRATCTSMCIMF